MPFPVERAARKSRPLVAGHGGPPAIDQADAAVQDSSLNARHPLANRLVSAMAQHSARKGKKVSMTACLTAE